ASDVGTLRLLVVAVPLLVWNTLELHVRAAHGRQGIALWIGLGALVLNVALCAWLIDAHGLVGAAIALLATEAAQAVALVATSRQSERRIVVSTVGRAALATVLLTALAVVLA